MDFITNHPVYLQLQKTAHPQDFEVLKQVLVDYEFDLHPTYGYFTAEDFDKIKSRALSEFFEELTDLDDEEIDGEQFRFLWGQVRDRFSKKYWGFQKLLEKNGTIASPQRVNLPLTPLAQIPKKPLEKVSFSENFSYLWPVFCSMVLTKSLIVWYGRELSIDDSPRNKLIFAAVVAFAFGSLFWFAWRRRRKKKKKVR